MPYDDYSIERITELVAFYLPTIPESQRRGIQVLLNAHDHVWRDRGIQAGMRLATCELLFNLALELMHGK